MKTNSFFSSNVGTLVFKYVDKLKEYLSQSTAAKVVSAVMTYT